MKDPMDTKTKSTKSKSKPKTQLVSAWVNAEEKKLPDRGEDGSYSLSLLLEYYSPSVLATFIEQHGIFTQDRYGRQIHVSARFGPS